MVKELLLSWVKWLGSRMLKGPFSTWILLSTLAMEVSWRAVMEWPVWSWCLQEGDEEEEEEEEEEERVHLPKMNT